MSKWVWPRREALLAARAGLLAEHGGETGIRDAAALDAALARPEALGAYKTPDAAAIASAYACALAKARAFAGGNNGFALVALEGFLALNGLALAASDAECVVALQAMAAGEADEREFAAWLRARLTARL